MDEYEKSLKDLKSIIKGQRKKYNRTKEELDSVPFNNELVTLLYGDSMVDIDVLCETLGTSNRVLRDRLSQLSMQYPIISLSCNKGYRIINVNDPSISDLSDIDKEMTNLKNRIEVLKKRLKPLENAKKTILSGYVEDV